MAVANEEQSDSDFLREVAGCVILDRNGNVNRYSEEFTERLKELADRLERSCKTCKWWGEPGCQHEAFPAFGCGCYEAKGN